MSTETRLLHDLGMTGDDGLEFMEVFAKHFQVEMTGFEPGLYFGEEAGGDPMTWFYFLAFKSKRPKFIPINIKDLANSAKKKKWIEPKAEAVS